VYIDKIAPVEYNLPIVKNVAKGSKDKFIEGTEGYLLVTSQRYKDLATGFGRQIFIAPSMDDDTARMLCRKIKSSKIKRIISIGSGRVIDIAKLASKKCKVSHTAIPACLSTNCFATDKTTLFVNGVKKTVSSRVPDKVVIDLALLAQYPNMNIYGAIELMSSATALLDWEIADRENRESVDEVFYNDALKLAESSLCIIKNGLDSSDKLWGLVCLLSKSGKIVQEYGCGRPVSGSEHILSAAIENHYRCPHGASLYIALAVAQALQSKISFKKIINLDPLYKMEAFRHDVTSLFERKKIADLLSNVSPRPNRFTCLDLAKHEDLKKSVKDVCNDLFE